MMTVDMKVMFLVKKWTSKCYIGSSLKALDFFKEGLKMKNETPNIKKIPHYLSVCSLSLFSHSLHEPAL